MFYFTRALSCEAYVLQSGFNAGDGRGYTTALNDAELKQAQNSYGSDVIGRYIYRIDTEQIVHGGCSNSRQGKFTFPFLLQINVREGAIRN